MDTKKKMGRVPGTKDSDESRQRKSEGQLRSWSEGKRKANPGGWKLTDETKAKMSAAAAGKPKSPEHRAALSRAKQAYDARRASGEV